MVKVVMEREQTQMLADLKKLYEKCTDYENTIAGLEAKSSQVGVF